MGIYARAPQSNFKPAPEGLHQAVCCDVWEPWTETSAFHGGLVDKTRLVWQIAEQDEEHGRPYEVSQIYTLSLHEKAKLCQHLESWRGRKFTNKEKEAFDLESLLGVNCQLQVVHNVKEDGRVFANVQAIVPLGKGQVKLRISDGFVRKKDRKENGGGHADGGPVDLTDDSVPF